MEKREIKYRAWDKINNVMHNNIWSINWDFTPKEPKALLTSIASNDVINSEYILKEPNFILMQFTGLKDKNNVEVYEGDVVKVSPENTVFGGFPETEFTVEMKTEKGYWYPQPMFNKGAIIQVLSNIFQNKIKE